MRYTVNDLAYNGKYHKQFWDKAFNPNADIENGLANCTTAVIGFCLVENDPYPVSMIKTASKWDEVLINDWKEIPFDPETVRIGDIIQWKEKCHVAKVADIIDGKIYINGSFYTGDHGKAYYDNDYDSRSFKSLAELSDFMIRNYPERFYHFWSLEKESSLVGGSPEKIFVRPDTLIPTERNTSINQIETTDNTLRIRTQPNLSSSVIGHVSVGFYNVLDIKEAETIDRQREPDLKCWYEISKGRWIGNVTTIYHEANEEDDFLNEVKRFFDKIQNRTNALIEERDACKERLKKIHELSEVDL